ncbi:MAG: aminopeptidase P N-terminal domain-containing protein [Fusobacteriaceae bacterium]
MFDKQIYLERRKKLSEKMMNGVGIFLGNTDSPIDYADNCYDFNQDSTFKYFFGMDRAGLIAIIDFENGESYISGKDFTLGDMIWMGEQTLISEERKTFGIENFISSEEFQEWFKVFSERKKIHFILPHRSENLLKLSDILEKNYKDLKSLESLEIKKAIIEMRNIKTCAEVSELEKATDVTRLMHLKAMEMAKAGVKEYEIAGAVEAIAKTHDCTLSFQIICSTHGEVLHNHSHSGVLKDGDLLLLDCGAKTSSGYCGDMTTTVPVGGKFNETQKKIYNILIEMFDSAVEKLEIGKNFRDAHNAACKKLIERFKELGILKGDSDEIFQNSAHALFFPHGLGHMIGMDVHDMENYGENLVGYGDENIRDTRFGFRSLRMGRKLEKGFVFTVEPGVYFIPRLIQDWKERDYNSEFINFNILEEYLNFGGMRYEGDFIMEEKKARRLGKPMPKSWQEIESTMLKK